MSGLVQDKEFRYETKFPAHRVPSLFISIFSTNTTIPSIMSSL